MSSYNKPPLFFSDFKIQGGLSPTQPNPSPRAKGIPACEAHPLLLKEILLGHASVGFHQVSFWALARGAFLSCYEKKITSTLYK